MHDATLIFTVHIEMKYFYLDPYIHVSFATVGAYCGYKKPAIEAKLLKVIAYYFLVAITIRLSTILFS